ncbi:MAG: pantoate--beta-alanine ligase [Spirochaetia bacterium]|nr:pantoate--beta-alanine ligase [Spirochaetia bacterium]
MIQIVSNPLEWQRQINAHRKSGWSIGFVPTMGALHAGHISLMHRSKKENDITCASIFVNPAQFDNSEDLDTYPSNCPSTREADIAALKRAGVDMLLYPETGSMYPDNYQYRVLEQELSQKYCGKFRPGHFDGVLTVVLKLLNLTHADHAYFGEKDWQQLVLIRRMAEAFFLETEIVPCPTVREASGLALSSRNARLSPKDQETAPWLYKTLISDISLAEMRTSLEDKGFEVEYIEEFNDRAWGKRLLAAVMLGKVRLIDNVERN